MQYQGRTKPAGYASADDGRSAQTKAERRENCCKNGRPYQCPCCRRHYHVPISCGLWTCKKCARVKARREVEWFHQVVLQVGMQVWLESTLRERPCDKLLVTFRLPLSDKPTNADVRKFSDHLTAFKNWIQEKGAHAAVAFIDISGSNIEARALYVGAVPPNTQEKWRAIAGPDADLLIEPGEDFGATLERVFNPYIPDDPIAQERVEAAFTGTHRFRAWGLAYNVQLDHPRLLVCPHDQSDLDAVNLGKTLIKPAVGGGYPCKALEAIGYVNLWSVAGKARYAHRQAAFEEQARSRAGPALVA